MWFVQAQRHSFQMIIIYWRSVTKRQQQQQRTDESFARSHLTEETKTTTTCDSDDDGNKHCLNVYVISSSNKICIFIGLIRAICCLVVVVVVVVVGFIFFSLRFRFGRTTTKKNAHTLRHYISHSSRKCESDPKRQRQKKEEEKQQKWQRILSQNPNGEFDEMKVMEA